MIEFLGFIFITILGTLGHFMYDWSHHNKFIAYFCAVNESTWEHMKLAMGPSFLWLIIKIPFLFSNPNLALSSAVALLVMIILIPLLYYLYLAIFKKDNFIFDIFEFIFTIFCGQLCAYYLLKMPPCSPLVNYLSIILLIIIFIYYLTHTFLPRNNFLFKDPKNNKYGLDAHE